MIKYKPNCAVCKELKKNKKLLTRIFNSSFYIRGADEGLLRIAGDYKGIFSYDSLKNHSKRHQFLNAEDYTQKMLRKQAQSAKKHVVATNLEQLAPSSVWDEVLSRGMDELKAGNMDIKMSDLLKAVKDRTDFDFKKSDQQLQLMETIAHFTSGENTENERIYDRRSHTKIIDADTGLPTAALDSWQNQSSDFHQSLAGGTAPSGAS